MAEAVAAVVAAVALAMAGTALGSLLGVVWLVRRLEARAMRQIENLEAWELKAQGWLKEAAAAHNSVGERLVLLEDRMRALDFVSTSTKR